MPPRYLENCQPTFRLKACDQRNRFYKSLIINACDDSVCNFIISILPDGKLASLDDRMSADGMTIQFRGAYQNANELLTHWGRDKIATISKTTFSNAFSQMKIYDFKVSLRCIPNVRINNIPALVQIMVWRRRIYASLGLSELNPRTLKCATLHKNRIFQSMGKILCLKFYRYSLEFRTKCITHTLKYV